MSSHVMQCGQGREGLWHGFAFRPHDHDLQGPSLFCAHSQGEHAVVGLLQRELVDLSGIHR